MPVQPLGTSLPSASQPATLLMVASVQGRPGELQVEPHPSRPGPGPSPQDRPGPASSQEQPRPRAQGSWDPNHNEDGEGGSCPPSAVFPSPSPTRRILLNHAVCNPAVSYSQGEADLVAPMLAEVLDESDTFWRFVGLLQDTIFVSPPQDKDTEKQLVRAWAGSVPSLPGPCGHCWGFHPMNPRSPGCSPGAGLGFAPDTAFPAP